MVVSERRELTGFGLAQGEMGDWIAGQLQTQALKFAGANDEVYEIIDSMQANQEANELQASNTLGATISNDSTTLNQLETTANNNSREGKTDFQKWNYGININTDGPDQGGSLDITSPGMLNDGRTRFNFGINHHLGYDSDEMKQDPSTTGSLGLEHQGKNYNFNLNMNMGHRKSPEFKSQFGTSF